jgi:hypothetical protein
MLAIVGVLRAWPVKPGFLLWNYGKMENALMGVVN